MWGTWENRYRKIENAYRNDKALHPYSEHGNPSALFIFQNREGNKWMGDDYSIGMYFDNKKLINERRESLKRNHDAAQQIKSRE